jgi:PKD repeat protein
MRQRLCIVVLICLCLFVGVASAAIPNTSTVLYLPLNQTAFADFSASAHTITNTGSVLADANITKYGGASALFSGSNTLSAPASSDFTLSTNTISVWVNESTLGNYWFVGYTGSSGVGVWGGNGIQWYLQTDSSGKPQFQWGSSSSITAASPLVANKWNLVTLTVSGSNATLYVNGTEVATTSSFSLVAGTPTKLSIGSNGAGGNYMVGRLDDVIFTKNVMGQTTIQDAEFFINPTAAFTQNVTEGSSPLPVSFTNTSSGNIPNQTYRWYYTNSSFTGGNGTQILFSTSASPELTLGAGNWTINENVTNTYGESSATSWVNVSAAGASPSPISASFTSSSNPSTVNTAVTFTDTSTGTPTTWNWTIAGSITNTTQNASYLFDTSGTYAVDLNVTNASGHFSNYTLNQVVTNVSGFTQQDIWMEGQYLQTFNIVDSNNLPIANVTIGSTSGNSYTTSNGTGYLTEPFGAATVTFVSNGYTSRAISYVFDSDDTHSVTMYTATPPVSSNVNTLYSPQTVHLTIVDAYGVPQPGAYVTVSYIASSLPSTDTNWLTTNFGVDTDVAADMVNSSVLQRDYTGSDGGFVFTAFPVIRYNITAVNATTGMNHRTEITPKDSHYVIYCPLTGQARGNNTLIARQNATLPWYSLNNTHIMLGMTYQDTTSCTSSVRFRAWFQTNGSEIHNTTWSGFGSALILDNHTIPKAPIGTEYLWQYNATRVC